MAYVAICSKILFKITKLKILPLEGHVLGLSKDKTTLFRYYWRRSKRGHSKNRTHFAAISCAYSQPNMFHLLFRIKRNIEMEHFSRMIHANCHVIYLHNIFSCTSRLKPSLMCLYGSLIAVNKTLWGAISLFSWQSLLGYFATSS